MFSIVLTYLLLALPPLLLAILVPLSPVLQTYLTSGIMWVVNKGLGWLKGKSDTVKRLVLGVIGVLVAFGAGFIGQTVNSDPMTWGITTAQGIAQALVSHLIYGFGKESTT